MNHPILFECPYNKSVICDFKKCERCGWNPRVDQVRKAVMRIKLGNEPPIVREKWRIGNGAFAK